MASDFCVEVGNRIKKYRKERALTLKELADKVGLTAATIQKYEAGNIKKLDVKTIEIIANALSVKSEVLVGWESEYEEANRHTSVGGGDAHLVSKYRNLSNAHKKAVLHLIDDLLSAQEKNNTNI